MRKFKILVFLTVVLIANNTEAQRRIYDTTTANIMFELLNVQSYLSDTAHLSFDVTYYMEDIDTVTVRDTITGNYKIRGENFKVVLDSVIGIQDDKYYGSIYHDAQTIVVQRPVSVSKQVLQVDVMDSVFQNMAMTSMTASDSGSYRKIVLHFDENAIYNTYEMVYNKSNFRTAYIKYSMKKELSLESTKQINIGIHFSNYQTGGFNDSVFATAPYFIVKSSKEIKSGTSLPVEYEIVNLLENN